MSGAETYNAFLLTELEREHKRRESLDTRASATATASVAVLTLAGVVAAAIKAGDGALVHSPAAAIFAAAFLLAVVLAIIATAPRPHVTNDLGVLDRMVGRVHVDDEASAAEVCAIKRLQALRDVCAKNRFKVLCLAGAQWLQLVGVVALAQLLGLFGWMSFC